MRSFVRRALYFALVLAIVISGSLAPGRSVALSESRLDAFAQNNILFYDPEGGCKRPGGGGGVVTILPGNNVAEKVWNWFASAGIDGVSDNPNVIAGIIGNLMTESGGNTFNMHPFIVGFDGANYYYGLYQARADYDGAKILELIKEAGLDHLWWNYGSTPSNATDEQIDTAIDIELTRLLDTSGFRSFINHLSVVNDTPEGYAELFLVEYERAVNGDSLLEDPGARARVDALYGGRYGYNYQGTAARRNNAVKVFDAYASNTGGDSSTIVRERTQEIMNPCPGGGDGGELISGGMTLEEAIEFMKAYRSISPRNYHEPGGEILGRWAINDVEGCTSDLENCVAFTQWFICEYAGVCMGLPNGGKVVAALLNSGKGFTDGDHTPRPYAVFSKFGGYDEEGRELAGHTGVVLGVDEDRGKIIIGEAGCGASFDSTTAKEADLATFMGNDYTYAYTDNIIRLGT